MIAGVVVLRCVKTFRAARDRYNDTNTRRCHSNTCYAAHNGSTGTCAANGRKEGRELDTCGGVSAVLTIRSVDVRACEWEKRATEDK